MLGKKKSVLNVIKIFCGAFLAIGCILDLVVKISDNDNTANVDSPYCVGKTGKFSGNIYTKYIKRIIDKVLSLGGMIVFAPVYLFSFIAIYIEDPGNVIFKQKRVGKDKKLFWLSKMRSMKLSTPSDVPTHLLENPDQYILKCGAKFRKYSIDEIVQFWDIYRNKMSIIGPRPALWNQYDLVEERDKYGANDVLPGLTGWAQINGRDELEIPVKAKFDGEYIEEINKGAWNAFKMDVKCFIMTILSVIKSDGVVEGGTGTMNKEKVTS